MFPHSLSYLFILSEKIIKFFIIIERSHVYTSFIKFLQIYKGVEYNILMKIYKLGWLLDVNTFGTIICDENMSIFGLFTVT